MDASRWRNIEDLYHAVAEASAEKRADLLASADIDVRREVESLLAQQGSVLDQPAWENLTVTQIAPGAQLGPYLIERKIGEGGMGAVYRAHDSRLGRNVAIKIATAEFSGRFNREARVVAALNHPNICTLHDVGPNYLVMELLDGETLAARLKRGKLSIDETLKYGTQIAAALAAAHAKGIVHRDLKPANIMLTKAGAKILDFGIAKSAGTATATATNMVMGTPAYMAPEQREGKATDPRTDIYALGLVLQEMATGQRMTSGDTSSLKQLQEPFARIVERCLAQDPDERWQSACDVRTLLAWEPSATVPAVRRTWVPWAIAGLAILAASAGLLATRATPDTARSPIKFTFELPSAAQQYNVPILAAMSPDGRRLAFSLKDRTGESAIWIRALDSDEIQKLAGTENAVNPFWSPDGLFLAYFADSKLKKIALSGGPAQNICNTSPGVGGTWGRTGEIVFNPENRAPLMRVAASGGVPQRLTSLGEGENSHRWPSFLPDGRHYLFTARSNEKEKTAIYVGSLDSKVTKRILTEQSNAVYTSASSGHILFVRDGTLMAQRFDPSKLELSGEAFPVAANVEHITPSAEGLFTASTEGDVIAYSQAAANAEQLSWFERSGKIVRTANGPGRYLTPRLSPDGKRLAVVISASDSGNRDIWISELATGSLTRFTTDPANDWQQAWSPDGKSLTFASDRTPKGSSIYRKTIDGSGEEELLVESPKGGAFTPDWSPDGRLLIYHVNTANQAGRLALELWTTSFPDRTITPFKANQFILSGPRFSPDGKWVAYTSNETGAFEVYIAPVGRPGKQRVSSNGGAQPVWRRDGKEIFYLSRSTLMSSVIAASAEQLNISSPKPLFQVCPFISSGSGGPDYDVTADGGQFLFSCPSGDKNPRITISTHWLDTVKHPGQAGTPN